MKLDILGNFSLWEILDGPMCQSWFPGQSKRLIPQNVHSYLFSILKVKCTFLMLDIFLHVIIYHLCIRQNESLTHSVRL